MGKHTPGEWIGKATGAGQGLIYAENDGRNVAVAYHTRDTDLISAAPDMLAALKGYIEGLEVALEFICKPKESKSPEYVYDFIHRHKDSPVVKQIRAAIFKAEGGSAA
jgi:hypothetical protein